MYRYETKTELREALRGKQIREVLVTGALPDTRSVALRLTDGTVVEITATSFGTLQIEAG
jgi:hypothetical protein